MGNYRNLQQQPSLQLTFCLVISSILVLKTKAIMTFPEEGVYSLFPHEDLRTGRRTIRFEDSDRGSAPLLSDRYQDGRPPPPPLDLGRDDFPRPTSLPRPSSEPLIVDILRPTSNSLRDGLPELRDRPNVFRGDRDRDRVYFTNNHRSPRVQFVDDERRVYGYGKKYYHNELPPRIDEPSRETNLIRPSPIDYNRDDQDRRYLPNTYSYHPEAKLPPGARDRDRDSSGEERTRIHIFHPGNARRNYQGYRQPDGPARVDVPGTNAFLNHDEYLEFHTKLALDTLNKERKKLEEAQKKFASRPPPSPRPINKVGGLNPPPPNFSKEVTVIQEDHISTSGESSSGSGSSSCEDDKNNSGGNKGNSIGTTKGPGGTNNVSQERKKFNSKGNPGPSSTGSNGNGESTSTPKYFSTTPTAQGISTSTDADKPLLIPTSSSSSSSSSAASSASSSSSTETGFLPIVPFHLQGSTNPTATVVKIDPTQNRLSPSYTPTTEKIFKGNVTPQPAFPPFETTTPRFRFPSTTNFNTNFNLEVTNNKSTTTTTTTARIGPADIAKVKFQSRPPSSLLTLAPQSTSTPTTFTFSDTAGRHTKDNTKEAEGKGSETVTEESVVMNQPVRSPSIFIDSQEVNGFYNGTGPNPRDKMMIYVERVKSHLNAHRKEGQVSEVGAASMSHQSSNHAGSTKRKTSSSSSSKSSNRTTMSYSSSSKIESHVRVEESTLLSSSSNDLSPTGLNHSIEFITDSPELKVTTGHGINSGVVAKVHAHISHCPKLFGPVEIICDVHVRERHGNPNPYLTVGWTRKFYNETTPDKLVAVNKTLAYEEDFHDKFNVTLAPGISPMLRSVLIIREVTVPDCGNYECEVFDGVSTHTSETLVFLCH